MELKYYSVKEVAELLGIHIRTIHVYIHAGKLPAFRLSSNGNFKILKEDVLKMLEPTSPRSKP